MDKERIQNTAGVALRASAVAFSSYGETRCRAKGDSMKKCLKCPSGP